MASDQHHQTNHHDGHSPYLAHHFESLDQQFSSGKLGMWLFLVTEILLFGGLFCAYAVYRANHPEIFIYAHQFLDAKLGGINTVVLICSSLTMAWAVRCAQLGKQKALCILLAITLLGGFGFLGIKYLEYQSKWKHGLLWGREYAPKHDDHGTHGGVGGLSATDTLSADIPTQATTVIEKTATGVVIERSAIPPAALAPQGLAKEQKDVDVHGHQLSQEPRNVQIFFSVYFLMTGLHGIHVIIGMLAIAWILVRSIKGHFGKHYFTPVDFVGLYWHLVDLIWIYLFPLLYLIH